MSGTQTTEWYKDLGISLKGEPTGIERMNSLSSRGFCYCIVKEGSKVDHVDVYQDGNKVHYKKFQYDNLGRVVTNMMYSPDGKGGWSIQDDVWYYTYDPRSGLRRKKIMQMLGAPSAIEVSYDEHGNRVQEKTVPMPQKTQVDMSLSK